LAIKCEPANYDIEISGTDGNRQHACQRLGKNINNCRGKKSRDRPIRLTQTATSNRWMIGKRNKRELGMTGKTLMKRVQGTEVLDEMRW